MVFWTSLLECILFVLLFFCFCFGVSSAGGLGSVWLHIFHVPRGLLGLLLIFKHLPKSHDIIDLVDFDGMSPNDLTVERVSSKVQLELSVLFMHKGEVCKKYLILYTLLTGQLPFDSSDHGATWSPTAEHAAGTWKPIPWASSSLAALLNAIFTCDVDARATVDALLEGTGCEVLFV